MRFGDAVLTVERPGGTDPYGNPLPAVTHTIGGCTVTPRGSEERTDGQATVITGLSVLAPPGSDLSAHDVVVDPPRYPGRWQVEGDPAVWDWLDGSGAGVVAPLTRAEG